MFKKKISLSLTLLLLYLTTSINGVQAESLLTNNTEIPLSKTTTIELTKTKVQSDGMMTSNLLHTEKMLNDNPNLRSVQPSSVEWQYVLNYSGYDGAHHNNFQTTADGGYIVAATTGNSLIWLTKIDAIGSIEWSYTYGQGNSWIVGGVRQTSDHGYILTGKVNDDVFLVKMDAAGNVEWLQLFGGADYDEGEDVVQTIDGGYFIIGSSKSYGDGHYEALLIKTNASGVIEWGSTITSTTRNEFGQQALIEPSSGNIIARLHSTLLSNDKTTLMEISNTGTVTQSKVHDDITDGIVSHMALTSGDGLVLTGRKSIHTNGEYLSHVSLVKLDAAFNKTWQKNYFVNGFDSYQCGECVVQTADGGYALTAVLVYYDSTLSKSFRDIGLLKLNTSGATEWIQTYNIRDNDYSFYVHQTSDSGYVLGGKTQNTDTDIFIFKLK